MSHSNPTAAATATATATVAADEHHDKKKKSKKSERTKLNFQIVQEGQYGRHPKEFKGSLVFTSQDSAHVLEKMGVRKEIYDHVDFDKHMLIYVCSGQKPTGGYGIVLKRVFQKHNSEGDLEVYAKDKEPKSGSFGTMALTLPFLVAQVEKTDLAVNKNEFPVAWMDKDASKSKDKKKKNKKEAL